MGVHYVCAVPTVACGTWQTVYTHKIPHSTTTCLIQTNSNQQNYTPPYYLLVSKGGGAYQFFRASQTCCQTSTKVNYTPTLAKSCDRCFEQCAIPWTTQSIWQLQWENWYQRVLFPPYGMLVSCRLPSKTVCLHGQLYSWCLLAVFFVSVLTTILVCIFPFPVRAGSFEITYSNPSSQRECLDWFSELAMKGHESFWHATKCSTCVFLFACSCFAFSAFLRHLTSSLSSTLLSSPGECPADRCGQERPYYCCVQPWP